MTRLPNRPSSHAHFLIKETAEAMGHELYDTMMSDDLWYGLWKKKNPGLSRRALEELFVKNNLSKLLPQARATLAQMLRNSSDPVLKEQIYDALILDATLVRGRTH
jgi:hypothetical protein